MPAPLDRCDCSLGGQDARPTGQMRLWGGQDARPNSPFPATKRSFNSPHCQLQSNLMPKFLSANYKSFELITAGQSACLSDD